MSIIMIQDISSLSTNRLLNIYRLYRYNTDYEHYNFIEDIKKELDKREHLLTKGRKHEIKKVNFDELIKNKRVYKIFGKFIDKLISKDRLCSLLRLMGYTEASKIIAKINNNTLREKINKSYARRTRISAIQ